MAGAVTCCDFVLSSIMYSLVLFLIGEGSCEMRGRWVTHRPRLLGCRCQTTKFSIINSNSFFVLSRRLFGWQRGCSEL
jgi:hypothetical protein